MSEGKNPPGCNAHTLAQVLKGHYGDSPSEVEFIGQAEAFIVKHFDGLKAMMEICKYLNKELGRAALSKAWPSLPKSSRETILTKLQGVYSFVRKKSHNVKSGARTSEALLALIALQAPSSWVPNLEGLPAQAKAAATAAPQAKASRALKVQVSAEDPEEIASLYGVGPAPKKHKAAAEVVEVGSSQETPKGASWWSEADQCLVRMSGSCLEQAKMQEGSDGFAIAQWPDGSTEQTERPNLCAQQLPTTSSKKKPAACKKLAAAAADTQDAAPALPVTGTTGHGSAVLVGGGAWVPSLSFGFMKLTNATGKSYIQAKGTTVPGIVAKPWCLVNVQGGSCKDHKAVAEQLLQFAKAGGLTKDMVVAERDGIISREG